MDLNKGGISRGIKALSNIDNSKNDYSVIYPVEDKLVILKNYLEKLLTLSPKQLVNENYFINKKEDVKSKNKKKKLDDDVINRKINNITPNLEIYKKMVIKILNFINKLGLFNEFRTITKIVGTIWLIIKVNKLKYNNGVFKQIKLEKNTVKGFCKKIEETMYFSYCEKIISDYNKLIILEINN